MPIKMLQNHTALVLGTPMKGTVTLKRPQNKRILYEALLPHEEYPKFGSPPPPPPPLPSLPRNRKGGGGGSLDIRNLVSLRKASPLFRV